MPCIAIDLPHIPDIPSPFKLPELPPPPILTIGACCILPALQIGIPPIPLPGVLNIAAVNAINAWIAALNQVLDGVKLDCPKN